MRFVPFYIFKHNFFEYKLGDPPFAGHPPFYFIWLLACHLPGPLPARIVFHFGLCRNENKDPGPGKSWASGTKISQKHSAQLRSIFHQMHNICIVAVLSRLQSIDEIKTLSPLCDIPPFSVLLIRLRRFSCAPSLLFPAEPLRSPFVSSSTMQSAS